MLRLGLKQVSQSLLHRTWLPATIQHASLLHTSSATQQQQNAKRPLFREAYFRRRDHIADDYDLIYKTSLELVVAGSKHLSTFSLSVVTALLGYRYVTEEKLVDLADKTFEFGPIMSDADDLMWFGVAFVVFNVSILAACDRVPLRIYRKKNDYVAMFEGLLPLSARPVPFVGGEMRENVRQSVLPWHESMYTLRKRSVILLTPCFKTPSELNEMIRPARSDEDETAEKPKKYE